MDLMLAYSNLRIDPMGYKVLGLSWRQHTYVDITLPFGFKQSVSGCTLVTDTVTFLMWTQRHWVLNYLDDIIGVSKASDSSNTFRTLHNLLDSLGLPINFKKVEYPSSEITCLGINKNSKTGILSIPQEKNGKN